MPWGIIGNLAWVIAIVSAGLGFLKWRYTPPQWQSPIKELENAPMQENELLQWLRAEALEHQDLTGIHVLDDGRDAFAARMSLIREAKGRIDLQYYMWNADLSGRLLFHEVLLAADRGVRIRMLLDDNTTMGTDQLLSALNTHHNIQIRLFNPFMIRKFRVLNYAVDFRRLNRRMHNKSLTIDNVATVIGGRNIGDAYFSAHEGMQFADMDVLATGQAVVDVGRSFDAYWSSKSSYAAESVLKRVVPAGLERLRTELNLLAHGEVAHSYLHSLRKSTPLRELKLGTLSLEWVPAVLVVDDPAKGQGDIPRRRLLLAGIEKSLGQVQSHIDVATAYFVPGSFGTKFLGKAASQGKRVRVLTNSLASNDVVPVHAGYARYRKQLLQQGVLLYELRSKNVVKSKRRGGKSKLPRFGAANSSLHAKIFTMDDCRVFIGSFNFDPRSLYLNCEMGLLVDSEALAAHVTRRMEDFVATRSYTPFLEADGRLSWRDSDNLLYKMEPESTMSQRVVAWVISWLPVEWLL